MSIGALLSNASQSLQASINRTAIAGSAINVENGDYAKSAVGMMQGAIESKASMNVIKTADEILGTLIDISA